MSYQTVDRYCKRCRSATPFEIDTNGIGHCTLCAEKRGPTYTRYQAGTLAQHISALDGAANRRETAPRRRSK